MEKYVVIWEPQDFGYTPMQMLVPTTSDEMEAREPAAKKLLREGGKAHVFKLVASCEGTPQWKEEV